ITDWRRRREFAARWLGYGVVDVERAFGCTAQRATLIGVAEVAIDDGLVFEVPLPPSLSAQAVSRRMTVTLAWFSPTKSAHQAYRSAKLWISPPKTELRVKHAQCVHDHSRRGTLQHDVLEGDDAVAYVDGAKMAIKVNCSGDAEEFEGTVPFALCVSLEVAVETGLPIYQEIRARVVAAVQIQAA
ncbi:MAG TPA: hypothetical protein VNU21_20350, partial [Usitatibacter sp.]|nr:hypothetical protein [Usitatibacter sp.]